MECTPEFDAFGPWIYPVRRPEEVPPVFRSYPLDLATARLVLKVPRPIERRVALPTMHLYDYLLVAGETALTVLRRAGDAYQVLETPYARLGAARVAVSLLQGRLALYDVSPAATRPMLDVPFNGVSSDVVERLVDLLVDEALRDAPQPAEVPSDLVDRWADQGVVGQGVVGQGAVGQGVVGQNVDRDVDRRVDEALGARGGSAAGAGREWAAPWAAPWAEPVPPVAPVAPVASAPPGAAASPAPSSAPGPAPAWAVGDDDVALVVAHRELAERRPGLVRLGDHARVLVPRGDGVLRGLRDRWWPVTLHAAIVSAGPGCVEVLHREELTSVGARPVWSIARTTLLTGAVGGVTLQPDPRYDGVVEAGVAVGGCVLRFAFPEGAASAAALAGAVAVPVA